MPASTIPPEELFAWLRLNAVPGLGAVALHTLLKALHRPEAVFTASLSQLTGLVGADLAFRLRQAPDPTLDTQLARVQAWQAQPGHHLLTWADTEYPAALLKTAFAPPLLYAHGQLACLARPMLAIVGARHPTAEGEYNAHAFAEYLAGQGWCIVSGLARGIDGAAHRGALQAGASGGGTVAVLGTGIDRIYPASHQALARQIAQEGLLLSQFPLGARGLRHHFPRRNHLVAALARGVLVVEAAEHSGSLITARTATELNHEVFAIPGSIHSPLSHGCHALIRQGAKLVESARDILEEWPDCTPAAGARTSPESGSQTHPADPLTQPPQPPDAPAIGEHETDALREALPRGLEDDAAAVLYVLAHQPRDIDFLQARLGWPLERLQHQLTRLELAGHLLRTRDGRIQRRPGRLS
ncbi:DNA-processing protein DprA [Castellaniella sp.]|uniref:DNA-processing protein DprA n=1 Tax=Castellaniella sp. TaxID=1955812 RepID=UPI0035644C1F